MKLSQIKEEVLSSTSIVVYGAGKLGHAVSNILENLGINKETFIVSGKIYCFW